MEQLSPYNDREALAQLKVLSNYIYELKKGVRHMALYTIPIRYAELSYSKLRSHAIDFFVQPVGETKVNIYFGRTECITTIRKMINCPLHQLTPEEDFILGTLLGYDVCAQCTRYCQLRERRSLSNTPTA